MTGAWPGCAKHVGVLDVTSRGALYLQSVTSCAWLSTTTSNPLRRSLIAWPSAGTARRSRPCPRTRLSGSRSRERRGTRRGCRTGAGTTAQEVPHGKGWLHAKRRARLQHCTCWPVHRLHHTSVSRDPAARYVLMDVCGVLSACRLEEQIRGELRQEIRKGSGGGGGGGNSGKVHRRSSGIMLTGSSVVRGVYSGVLPVAG